MDKPLIVGIHQPTFLPWPGFFHKLISSNIFVNYDIAQFTKGAYGNRTLIKNRNFESQYLTVPVKTSNASRPSFINSAIDYSSPWQRKILNSIYHSYHDLPYFSTLFEDLEKTISEKFENLADLNTTLIKLILQKLQISTNYLQASKMNIKSNDRDEKLIEIIKKSGGTIYLSGHGAKEYNNQQKFDKNNIKLIYTDYNPSCYAQHGPDFISNLSIIDAIFNIGIDSTIQLLNYKDYSLN